LCIHMKKLLSGKIEASFSKKKKNWYNVCSLKSINKTEPNKVTNTCINWYAIKSSGIYWNNLEAWNQVLLKTNFPAKFSTKQFSFRHFSTVFSHGIGNILLYLSICSEVWKLLFQWIILCVHYPAYYDVRIA
jgi:hypothetical protein